MQISKKITKKLANLLNGSKKNAKIEKYPRNTNFTQPYAKHLCTSGPRQSGVAVIGDVSVWTLAFWATTEQHLFWEFV